MLLGQQTSDSMKHILLEEVVGVALHIVVARRGLPIPVRLTISQRNDDFSNSSYLSWVTAFNPVSCHWLRRRRAAARAARTRG